MQRLSLMSGLLFPDVMAKKLTYQLGLSFAMDRLLMWKTVETAV